MALSTATSSGKSVVFNVSVLEAIIGARPTAVALYLFPTKALAQDQLRFGFDGNCTVQSNAYFPFPGWWLFKPLLSVSAGPRCCWFSYHVVLLVNKHTCCVFSLFSLHSVFTAAFFRTRVPKSTCTHVHRSTCMSGRAPPTAPAILSVNCLQVVERDGGLLPVSPSARTTDDTRRRHSVGGGVRQFLISQ